MARRKKIYEDWDEDQLKIFIEDKWKKKDIADFFGVSRKTVNNAIDYYNLNEDEESGEDEDENTAYTQSEIDDITEQIRNSLIESLELPESLGDAIPISYDEDQDLFIINEYISKTKGHNFPIEVHIKRDRKTGNFEIPKFEVRGEKRKDLNKQLSDYL